MTNHKKQTVIKRKWQHTRSHVNSSAARSQSIGFQFTSSIHYPMHNVHLSYICCCRFKTTQVRKKDQHTTVYFSKCGL